MNQIGASGLIRSIPGWIWPLCASSGCTRVEVIDISEIVLGPGVANEDPTLDGVGWDGATPIPAATFSALIDEGTEYTIDDAVSQAASYDGQFPPPTINGSVVLTGDGSELESRTIDTCYVEETNRFDCSPIGRPSFLAADVDGATAISITLDSAFNSPNPVAFIALDAADLDYDADVEPSDVASRAFNVVSATGGTVLSVETRRYVKGFR